MSCAVGWLTAWILGVQNVTVALFGREQRVYWYGIDTYSLIRRLGPGGLGGGRLIFRSVG